MPVGSGRLKGRIPDLLGSGAGERNGFLSFWPTCRVAWGGVGLGASEEGLSVCNPKFDRKFDQMFEIVE